MVNSAGFVYQLRGATAASDGAVVTALRLEMMMVLGVMLSGGGMMRMLFPLVLLSRPHLLQLHPPVLEPDLDLSLGEAQRPGDVGAAVPCEVHVVEELLLQFEGLELGVGFAFLARADV